MIFKNKKTNERHFRFAELKVYASTEWLAEGKKKYRTVFENSETTYLYAELSFYNRSFDVEEWQANIVLKCFKISPNAVEREQICTIEVNQKISKDDVLIYVREGWGNQQAGQFWTKGDYIWEAHIDNELVGSKPFYVENGGLVSEDENPYFEIQSVKLFEGGHAGKPFADRVYYTTFAANETSYIWVEMKVKNLQIEDWYCELQFLFHNENGQLKGKSIELKRIYAADDEIFLITGWGSDAKNSWFAGKFAIDVIFMDKRIAVIPFEVASDFENGIPAILTNANIFKGLQFGDAGEEIVKDEPLEVVLAKLNDMIGLNSIKQKVEDYTQFLRFVQLRKNKGLEEKEKINLNVVFTGNPGTGKTTVARIIAKIYHKLGFLSKGKLVEVTRAELVGQYIGQTAPKVKEVIEKARGGVLFIDEAYSLIRNNDDSKDYGHEVVETLIKEMSDGKGDIAIIVAGYPKEMKTFLESNPGFKSRFNLFYDFPDYTPQELIRISDYFCKIFDMEFLPSSRQKFQKLITDEFRKRDKTFGNARKVNQLLIEVKMNMALRIMQMPEPELLEKDALMLVEDADVNSLLKKLKKERPEIGVDDDALLDALTELQEMVGLSEVKKQISELVSLVKFYGQTQKEILNKFSLHTVFKGNPGTGKTTVARILAKIYRALGLLERGHIVECDREGLVAGFIGQTAIKTKAKIDEAIGGVLFIDEAYSLSIPTTQTWDFGSEAIEILLKQMEDRRGDFIVIVAGYPDKMDKFIESNPGLKSRFDKTLTFEDFTSEQLYEIAIKILESENLVPDQIAQEYIKTALNTLYNKRDKYFGNARTIRKIINEAIRKQHLRMAHLAPEERTIEALKQISIQDLKAVNFVDEDAILRKKIGFQASDGQI